MCSFTCLGFKSLFALTIEVIGGYNMSLKHILGAVLHMVTRTAPVPRDLLNDIPLYPVVLQQRPTDSNTFVSVPTFYGDFIL